MDKPVSVRCVQCYCICLSSVPWIFIMKNKMSPLLVGMLLLIASTNGDVKHVLEGSASPPDLNSINADARAINYLAHSASGSSAGSFSGSFGGAFSGGHGNFAPPSNALPFWWMDQNSPFKHAYEYYKRCSLKGNCVPPVVPQPQPQSTPQGGCGGTNNNCGASASVSNEDYPVVNIKNNPFLNGQFQSVAVSSCSGTACKNGKPETVVTTCEGKDCKTNVFVGGGATSGCANNNCGGQSSEGFAGTIDISKNPFLNGAFAGGSVNTQTVLTSGNGATIEDTGNGFLGVQPFPPFGKDQQNTKPRPFPTTFPDQNRTQGSGIPFPTAVPSQPGKKPFPISHPGQQDVYNGNPFLKPSKSDEIEANLDLACKGVGYICVAKELCQNGVVVKNGEGLLQARIDVQFCNPNTEVCCHLSNSQGKPNEIPANGNGVTAQSFFSTNVRSGGSFASASSGSFVGSSDLSAVTAGKSSVPGSTIKFSGGAGLSPGLIHVLPAASEPRPQISFAGESGSDKHYGSSTKPTRDIGSNSVFSSTIDYSDTNFGDVRFAPSIKGPEYLPPRLPSPTSPPVVATYQPTFRPIVTSSPAPFVTPDFSGNQPTTKTPYSPTPSTPALFTTPKQQQPSTYKQFTTAQPTTPKPTFQTIYGNNQFASSGNRPFSQSTPAPFRPTESRQYLPPKPGTSSNVNNQYYPQKPLPTPPQPQRPSYTPSSPTYRPTPFPTRPPVTSGYVPPSPTTQRPILTQPQRPSYKPSSPTYRPTPAPTRPPVTSAYVPPSPTPQRPTPPPSRPILTQPQRPIYKPSPVPTTITPQVTNRYTLPQPKPTYFTPQTYQPSTNSREYLPPRPSTPKPPLTSFTPQRPSSRPYTPAPSTPFVPGFTVDYQPSSPQSTNNVNVQYVPPFVQSTQRPPTSAEYLPPSPTTVRPVTTRVPNPSDGYVYNKPTPSFSYPTTTTSQPLIPSQTNVGNQYVPPPKKPTPKPNIGYLPPRTDEQSGSSVLSPNIQPQPGDSNIINIVPFNPDNTGDSANSPNIFLQTTQKSTFTGELNTTPHPGCAAALKCVQEIYCTADGVISPVPVVLSKEQELTRVPTTVCADQESGIVGKCCRDPNYQDPWPSANLVNGVDDGQYKEDPSLGQYVPDLQRPVRSGRQASASLAPNANAIQAVPQNKQQVCGEVHRNTQPKGPGPIDANFAQFPWQAMILRDSNRSLLCGGAIIRRDAVLTTASCVEGLDTKDVLIKGGEWKLGIDEEPLPFQIVKVAVIARHPDFQPGQLMNNMAILMLEENLRFANNIGTICLPEPNKIPIQNCIVTGWGKRILQLHARGAIMHWIGVDVMKNEQCQSSLRLPDNSNVLCGVSSKDQCLVDYGSAMACSSDNSRYTLSGIFVADSGCKSRDQIGAYVAPDVDWINTCLSKPLKELKQEEKQYRSARGF